MRLRLPRASARFKWSVFRGRCRRNLLVGLALCLLAGAYGSWAAERLRIRGADARGFDRPIEHLAQSLIRQPAHLRTIQPQNNRELYLATVISDQRDVLVALTVLVLRLIIVMTVGSLGLILLATGATEWEIRSEHP